MKKNIVILLLVLSSSSLAWALVSSNVTSGEVAAASKKCYAFDVTTICEDDQLAEFDAELKQWRHDRWLLDVSFDSLDLVALMRRKFGLDRVPRIEFGIGDDHHGKWAMAAFLASRPDLKATEATSSHCVDGCGGWHSVHVKNSAVQAVWPVNSTILSRVRPCADAFIKYWSDDEAAMFALYGPRAWRYKQVACPAWFLAEQEAAAPGLVVWK